MTPVEFFVLGDPVTQGNLTAVPTPAGQRLVEGRDRVARERHRRWRADVATAAMVACARRRQMVDRVGVELAFRLAPPRASAYVHPIARSHGDLDKFSRAVLDGLVEGQALADDGLVVRLAATKRWARPGEPPGVHIVLDPDPPEIP